MTPIKPLPLAFPMRVSLIDFIMSELDVSRITATRYLDELIRIELLVKRKIGRENYYINTDLYERLSNVHQK
ncbi:MAG: hypothetical protein HOP34_07705 [Methylococcaceae bacterium]|nr:hypothetical protein [Methylococcaceae bacterium]